MIQKILLLVAMDKEAQPIVSGLKMTQISHLMDKHLPAQAYDVAIKNGHIILVVSGKCVAHGVDRIGSEGLNLLAWEALKAFNPDIIINVGTAGGFQKNGATPGDVYVSADAIKFHDRLFHPDLHYLNYGIGSYPCLSVTSIAKKIGLKEGVISTGGSLISSQEEDAQMIKNNAAVKEMEAAGIAEVAQMRGVPFIGLKIVTDLVDTNDCPQNQFTNNFDKLITHLADKTEKLCSELLGNKIDSII